MRKVGPVHLDSIPRELAASAIVVEEGARISSSPLGMCAATLCFCELGNESITAIPSLCIKCSLLLWDEILQPTQFLHPDSQKVFLQS
jgi:hypothetical protein